MTPLFYCWKKRKNSLVSKIIFRKIIKSTNPNFSDKDSSPNHVSFHLEKFNMCFYLPPLLSSCRLQWDPPLRYKRSATWSESSGPRPSTLWRQTVSENVGKNLQTGYDDETKKIGVGSNVLVIQDLCSIFLRFYLITSSKFHVATKSERDISWSPGNLPHVFSQKKLAESSPWAHHLRRLKFEMPFSTSPPGQKRIKNVSREKSILKSHFHHLHLAKFPKNISNDST